MTRPQVEHRGHVVYWSDNEDKWYCSDFQFSHHSLLKCRERIDKVYRALRNKSSVKCLRIDGGHGFPPEARDATLVEYLGSKQERIGYGKADPVRTTHSVAAMYARGSDRPSRNQCELYHFAADTPEVLSMIAQAKQRYDAAKVLQDEATAIVKAIPRLTDADIADLIRAADTKIDEGEA